MTHRNFYRSSEYNCSDLKVSTQSERIPTDKGLKTIPEIVDRIDGLLSLDIGSEVRLLLRDIMFFLNTCNSDSFAHKLDYRKSDEAYGKAVAYVEILKTMAVKQESKIKESLDFNIVGAILGCLGKDFIRDNLSGIKRYANDEDIVAAYFLFDDGGYRMAMRLSDNDFSKALELLAMPALRF